MSININCMLDCTGVHHGIDRKFLDLMRISKQKREEIDPPYHDYYLITQNKRKANTVMKCAERIYMQYQYDIVSDVFANIFADELNPIKTGRLENETEISLELLIDKYEITDIQFVNKKVANFLSFRVTYRCYKNSFDGNEYALIVDLMMKEDPTSRYIINKSNFEVVRKENK